MRKINYNVLIVGIGSLFIAGGPVAAILIAFHVQPDLQTTILKAGAAIAALASSVYFIIRAAMSVTTRGKADMIANMSVEEKSAVVAKIPADKQIELAKVIVNGKDHT